MQNWWGKLGVTALLMLGCVAGAMAEDVVIPKAEWEAMKARMNDMESRQAPSSVVSSVDTALDNKYGPNANVTTKTGKLTIGLLTQIWYYGIQNDHRGYFDDPATNAIFDTNETLDNDSFRIRRTELKFTMDLTENVRSVLMIDPSREVQGFPNFPSNQGNIKKGNNVEPTFLAVAKPVGLNSTAAVAAVQGGAFSAGPARLMQDAYINWHGCIPHHDVQVGQFKPLIGEEGIRPSGELDFAERSMVGFQADSRDMGISIHGSWWGTDGCADSSKGEGRIQYWGGVFNGAGSYFDPGNQQNRADTNDDKDYNARLLVRPLWDDCHGKLELGGSFMGGKKGEAGARDLFGAPINGLNRQQHWAARYNAWASYQAGWELTGLWLRTEWTKIWDRENALSVIDLLGNGTGNAAGTIQGDNATFSRQGIYGAIGYKLSESKICGIPCWLKPIEFVGRWEEFQNISVADAVNPRHTDSFYTKVWTAGVNYYIKGHNAKVQANYNWVDLGADSHSNATRQFHNVRNDNFIINFQVMF